MASELDNRIREIIRVAMEAGGPMEVEQVERNGVSYPAFKAAPASLAAMFESFCQQHGDAPFLVDGEIRLSFAETLVHARQVAGGLIARHGVRKGDRIGLAARNSANWIVAFMGILMAGGCATLLNGWWTGEELAEGIALAECTHVLADPGRAARLDGHDCGAWIIVFDHGDPEAGLGPVLGDPADLPQLTPDDLATILFTSGSTGSSKGAVCDHRSVVQATFSFAGQSLVAATCLADTGRPPAPSQAALVNVPLFHVTGLVTLLLQSFILGRKLVMMPRWDAREAMRLIEAETITGFIGVPLMSYEIATHPDRDQFNLTSCAVFVAGGAPRPVEHTARIRESLPDADPVIGYGLTETNAVGCSNFGENYRDKPNSTGIPARPLCEVAVFDDEGNQLSAGETGEVAIRTIANFLGYWRNPEATRAALRPDGWFLSGDLGYLDADGYLFIVDRKKDIIIRGGENIACIEVEQALYAHPGVAEASVFGLPDTRLGEVPVAVYLPRPGHDFTDEELRDFVAERLAAFKVPVRFWREDKPLPRLGTEKVDRRALKARYAAAAGDAIAGA